MAVPSAAVSRILPAGQRGSLVERMVKTVKKLLQQSDDPCLALLTFRSTPLPWCNLGPTELLMG